MGRNRKEISEGVLIALAAQAKERAKLLAGGTLCMLGATIGLLSIYSRLPAPAIGVPLAVLTFGLGVMVYRTTQLFKTAQKGPRIPRRIRLPFDSVVEIAVAQAPVQARTDMAVGARPPDPDEAEEASDTPESS